MTAQTLEDLLLRIAAQDRAAYSLFYNSASPKLFAILIRILGTRHEAEDALQEVFIKIWLRAQHFTPEKGQAMTWAIAIARNHAIDVLRARKPVHAGDEAAMMAAPDPSPSAEARLIAQGQAARILHCLKNLDPVVSAALRGAYLSGMSYSDLALAANVPINTMRTRLRRGLMSLKDSVNQ